MYKKVYKVFLFFKRNTLIEVHKKHTLCVFILFIFGHHQSFQYHFVDNCSAGVSVSWKIGKVEKEKALSSLKQESNKKVCVGKYAER